MHYISHGAARRDSRFRLLTEEHHHLAARKVADALQGVAQRQPASAARAVGADAAAEVTNAVDRVDQYPGVAGQLLEYAGASARSQDGQAVAGRHSAADECPQRPPLVRRMARRSPYDIPLPTNARNASRAPLMPAGVSPRSSTTTTRLRRISSGSRSSAASCPAWETAVCSRVSNQVRFVILRAPPPCTTDRKSTRLNSSHLV